MTRAYCIEPDEGYDDTTDCVWFDEDGGCPEYPDEVDGEGYEEWLNWQEAQMYRVAFHHGLDADIIVNAQALLRKRNETGAWDLVAKALDLAGYWFWHSDTRLLIWDPDSAPTCPDCNNKKHRRKVKA